MSKIRSDAVLAGLPDDKQQQIEDAVRPLSIRQGVAHLAGEWDIVASKTTLSDWLNERQARREAQEARDRVRKAMIQADVILDGITETTAADRMDNALMMGVREWMSDHKIKGGDPRDVAEIYKILTKDRELRQKSRSLDLDEQKYQRETCALFLKWFDDKRAREIAGGSGTHDDKIVAMKSLFFTEEELKAQG